MSAIIKTDLRVENSDAFINSILDVPSYVFISGQDPWTDENNPPDPLDSTEDELDALSDIVGIKKISKSDIVSVVPRNNWEAGTTYDQYDHTVDMINDRNPSTGDFYRFYVVTEDFNVYKCLSNNYGAVSQDRPTGTDPSAFTTPDGYIWKYMYTIQASEAFKFMTSNWMPCYTLKYNDGSAQWASQQAATPGSIERIEVTTSGTSYLDSNPPSVTVSGDGTGATASAVVNTVTGEIDDIVVTNPGQDYTYASITIFDDTGNGVGAEARAIISPRLGHGSNPRIELGATYLMIKTVIDGDEGGVIPVDVSYRMGGIVKLPGNSDATGAYTIAINTPDTYLYTEGETITGETSGATAILNVIDHIKGLLYVDNVTGQFTQGENISSQAYNSTAITMISSGFAPLTGDVYGSADINSQTGKILYQSNRTAINRVADQREEIIAVISF